MTDIREALDRIQARAAEATPGPWFAEDSQLDQWETSVYFTFHNGDTMDRDLIADVASSPVTDDEDPNAEFIAHARTDVDRLIEALESVLEDHQPVPHGAWANGEDMYVCSSCPDPCDAHWSAIYPCPTVSTITNALTEEDA